MGGATGGIKAHVRSVKRQISNGVKTLQIIAERKGRRCILRSKNDEGT
jgi:hypothetical protein